MKRSQTSKTGRRDFLKLLGLGGLGTAAGLSVGAKVLGGKVVASELPAEPAQELGSKLKVHPGSDYVPEEWAKETAKILREEIRRAPSQILRREYVPNELTVEFITRDGVVSTMVLQGSVRTTEEREVSELYDRGQLVKLVPGYDYISFDVEGSVRYFFGDIDPRQLNTLLEFDMRFTSDDEVCLLRDCMWTDIEQDLAFGLFRLRGVARTGEMIREA